MFVLDDDTAAVLDDLRKLIAKCETLVARGRRQSRNSHAEARPPQTLVETTLNLLNNTLQQIQQTHKVIATSYALLETVEQLEKRGANPTGHRRKPPLSA